MSSPEKDWKFIGLLGQNSSFVSAFNIAQVCLTWFVFTHTRSALAVGLVSIVETGAILLVSLPVGAWVDRANKGALLMLAGAMGSISLIALSIHTLLVPFSLSFVLILTALWGSSREIARSSALSALPDLVGGGSLSSANGVFRALSSSLGSIANAAAGGLILAFGVISGFEFSSGAYFLSALFALAFVFPYLSRPAKPASEMQVHSIAGDVKEGFKWLVSRKGFFLLTVSATFFNFFMEMAVTYFVIYVAVGLHSGSFMFGLILAALAAGDVSGSLAAGRLHLLRFSGKVNTVLYGGVPGLSILLMGLFPNTVVAVVFTFVAGFCLGISINVWLTSAHNIVPAPMRGRYFALDGVLSSISPAAIAAGAVVVSVAGVTRDFVLSGILMIATTAAFSLMKSLWSLDGRGEAENSTEKVV